MQFSHSVSMLLAGLLLVLSVAHASPVVQQRSPSKFVTLPIKRHPYEPKDLHPIIVTRQILNRGLQRLARFTGGPDPPRELLERHLMRSVLSAEGPDGLERRFNRRTLDETVVVEKRFNPFGPPSDSAPAVGNAFAAGAKSKSKSKSARVVGAAKTPTANNSLGLNIAGSDTSYIATVQIGSPARAFSILMDSGSSDFWVGGEKCKSTAGGGCGNHVFLGAQSSTSFVDTKKAFAVRYGKGSVNGTIVQDDVSIAGLVLAKHTFGAANLESPEFSDNGVEFDGLMGLAQSKLSNQKTDTPPDALAKSGLTSRAVVSYKLGRSRDGNNDGEITFGDLNPAKFDAKTLVTIPSTSNRGFWQAGLDDVTVDGKSLGLKGLTAVLDTGTTLIIAPTQTAMAIHAQIPGSRFDQQSGLFSLPCATTTKVSFTFGGRAFDIDSRDMSFVPVDGSKNFNSGDCISGISAGEFGGAKDLLVGGVFLKNAYFSTDFQNNTLSLAKLV